MESTLVLGKLCSQNNILKLSENFSTYLFIVLIIRGLVFQKKPEKRKRRLWENNEKGFFIRNV